MLAACTTPPTLDERFPVSAVSVGGTTLTVWVADHPAQRQQGLKGLTALPAGIDGMLFVWESPGLRSFTMSETVIPLEIWWFDEGGVLIGSTAMLPCPEAPCPSYPSPAGVRWALETPAGERAFDPGSVLSTG